MLAGFNRNCDRGIGKIIDIVMFVFRRDKNTIYTSRHPFHIFNMEDGIGLISLKFNSFLAGQNRKIIGHMADELNRFETG